MKKDRNSFFSQFGSYGYNNQVPMMAPQTNMFNSGMPQISSSMSAGMNTNINSYPTDYDYDTRISKIERELNRLDARISKLEQTNSTINTTNTDYNFANSMYMV